MSLAKRLRTVVMLLTLAVVLVNAPGVSAHPLGNFTISHYTEIHVTRNGLALEFILDMAEIPAFQEIALLDKNRDGKAGSEELGDYPQRQCEVIRQQISLLRNHAAAVLDLGKAEIAFPPGAGGLSTLRLSCAFSSNFGQLEPNDNFSFMNNNYPDRLGWREVVVKPDGVRLDGVFAESSISNRLNTYPADQLTSPLDVRQVSFQVVGDTAASRVNEGNRSQPQQDKSILDANGNRFMQLITLQDGSPFGMLLALLAAFVWGGLHSMTPGHGKAVVGAYLVGSRGTARHAVLLGLTTTITHTAGVFALGLITLFASRTVLPEQIFLWISLLSGLMVVSIGLTLTIRRLRAALAKRRLPGHSHMKPHQHIDGLEDHTHSHDQEQEHEHEDSHSHQDHTHLPPETGVTWRSLIAMGISGGLLPCPSALVVLLGAIALGRIGFGMALVVAFSLGLAGVLTGIGLLLVYGRHWFERMPVRSRVYELIPAASALVITILGVGISLRALNQIGWILW